MQSTNTSLSRIPSCKWKSNWASWSWIGVTPSRIRRSVELTKETSCKAQLQQCFLVRTSTDNNHVINHACCADPINKIVYEFVPSGTDQEDHPLSRIAPLKQLHLTHLSVIRFLK